MQEVSSVEVFPFWMSLFNFRVLLFLCEWNVRNEFHHVISQAPAGLWRLSSNHGFYLWSPAMFRVLTYPFEPWWFYLSIHLKCRALLPGMTSLASEERGDFFPGFYLLLFLRHEVSQILSLEHCWFVINPVCIYFRSLCLLMKQGLIIQKP